MVGCHSLGTYLLYIYICIFTSRPQNVNLLPTIQPLLVPSITRVLFLFFYELSKTLSNNAHLHISPPLRSLSGWSVRCKSWRVAKSSNQRTKNLVVLFLPYFYSTARVHIWRANKVFAHPATPIKFNKVILHTQCVENFVEWRLRRTRFLAIVVWFFLSSTHYKKKKYLKEQSSMLEWCIGTNQTAEAPC